MTPDDSPDLTVCHRSFQPRADRGHYEFVTIEWWVGCDESGEGGLKRRVEVTVSPAGQVAHVWLDGHEMLTAQRWHHETERRKL